MEISELKITKVKITEGTTVREGGIELLSSQEIQWMEVVAVDILIPEIEKVIG